MDPAIPVWIVLGSSLGGLALLALLVLVLWKVVSGHAHTHVFLLSGYFSELYCILPLGGSGEALSALVWLNQFKDGAVSFS